MGGLGLAAFALYYNRQTVADAVSDAISRGKKISFGTLDDKLGIVLETPEALRLAASRRMGVDIPMDAYSAARMARSEGAAQAELRVHVALNDLAALGWSSLHYLLTYSTDPTRRGVYGKQWSPAVLPAYPKANARRYATSANPYEGDVRRTLKAMAEHARGFDPSGGAVKFLDRSSMGVQAGTRSFAEVDASWRKDGLVAYNLPAYGTDLVLYRKA